MCQKAFAIFIYLIQYYMQLAQAFQSFSCYMTKNNENMYDKINKGQLKFPLLCKFKKSGKNNQDTNTSEEI
jgi:hypothetical protein